jgi:hypothetical protein
MKKTLKSLLALFNIILITIFVLNPFESKNKSHLVKSSLVKNSLFIETPQVSEHYVGQVKSNNGTVVRLLILKHAFSDDRKLSNDESRDIVQAANLAASRGLKISDIGSHHIDRDGNIIWGKECSLKDLKSFISEQMKIGTVPGDTLVIYTTGHGGWDGTLENIGQREMLMKIIAEAAEENKQETLWWQSSCYAAAGLPSISSLNEKQQSLLSMVASSSEHEVSYWGDQTYPMQEVFLALAEYGENIDPDQNGEITAKELANFMNSVVKQSGDLLFAKNSDEPIFGLFGPWSAPIVDQNGSAEDYSRDYVPLPTWLKKVLYV